MTLGSFTIILQVRVYTCFRIKLLSFLNQYFFKRYYFILAIPPKKKILVKKKSTIGERIKYRISHFYERSPLRDIPFKFGFRLGMAPGKKKKE